MGLVVSFAGLSQSKIGCPSQLTSKVGSLCDPPFIECGQAGDGQLLGKARGGMGGNPAATPLRMTSRKSASNTRACKGLQPTKEALTI
jgi:hypothetical protein